MKIFILLIAIINFIIGRRLTHKKGPQLILNCHNDCWLSLTQARCIARGAAVCHAYLNIIDCGLHRAVCKWRHGGCEVKQNACGHRCQPIAGPNPNLECENRP